jgi:hypothetical protein
MLIGAAFITAMVFTEIAAAATPPRLSPADIRAGLAQAECSIPPKDARIVGDEWLGRDLQIVEVPCWRAAGNAGSILFAVPTAPRAKGRLIQIEDWRDGRLVTTYSVASPGYDRSARTLNSTHKSRREGDCGTFKEWQWTGLSFRLIHVWRKDSCDGEVFDWEDRDRWQVFPEPAKTPSQPPPGLGGSSLAKCPPSCSHHNKTRLGSAATALSAKNQAQPVASAMKPAPDDR